MRDLGRQARALGADRVLDHLHQQRLAFGEDLLDRPGRLAPASPPPWPFWRSSQMSATCRNAARSRPISTNADCMPGQHARDLAHVDVADQAAARGALDVQLLHRRRVHHRDARLLRRDVDEDVLVHAHATCAARAALHALQQLRGLVQRQAHHAGVAAADLGDERARRGPGSRRRRPCRRLAGGDVLRGSPAPSSVAELAPRRPTARTPAALVELERDRGQHLVRAPGQRGEHGRGLAPVRRLAEDALAERDGGVGGEHRRRAAGCAASRAASRPRPWRARRAST